MTEDNEEVYAPAVESRVEEAELERCSQAQERREQKENGVDECCRLTGRKW